MWACDSKRGNCTDFHSVLIGMMRSSGIPARFEIGFPLPENKNEGDIPGLPLLGGILT
jgi:transglutaminase-like putative cysteine protease